MHNEPGVLKLPCLEGLDRILGILTGRLYDVHKSEPGIYL